MEFGNLSAQLRNWQEEARSAREAAAPARALRLAPEVVHKIERDLLQKAKGRLAPRDLARDRYAHHHTNTEFRAFMDDVTLPAWLEPRRDLIEFALAFLEADAMLFRSGYAKRHMIRRL